MNGIAATKSQGWIYLDIDTDSRILHQGILNNDNPKHSAIANTCKKLITQLEAHRFNLIYSEQNNVVHTLTQEGSKSTTGMCNGASALIFSLTGIPNSTFLCSGLDG